MKNTHNFATTQTNEVAKRIVAGSSVSVLGIPGLGITLLLKHLASQPLGYMAYIDVFNLPAVSSIEFFREILSKLGGKSSSDSIDKVISACKDRLEEINKQNLRTVICVAGFDQLSPEFSAEFFRCLRSLRGTNASKTVFVFGICRRLDALLPTGVMDLDISLFSSVYYLKPFPKEDMQYLISVYGPYTDLGPDELGKLITMSGGHFQLAQLLLGSERRNDPVKDPFIHLAFKNIFLHLNPAQRNIIKKLAADGVYNKPDSYLTDVGLVRKTKGKYELFSTLFADCVRAFNTPKLPVKEKRLLAILKKNQGKIVSKRDIYDAVWRGKETGSEWALNALVYRLRRHPVFTAQHYMIENHKKLGYTLLKTNDS